MALSKSQRSNLIFFGIIALIFFTPIKGHIQGFVHRLISPPLSDKVIEEADYDWDLKGINTADYNFENAKGKVAFINYWATWCPPCREEMPSIQKLYIDYKDKVEFVFITKEDAETVNSFLNKKNYSLPSYNEKSKSPSEFYYSSIPTTFVLNKKGEIVDYVVGSANWNTSSFRKKLDKLLEE